MNRVENMVRIAAHRLLQVLPLLCLSALLVGCTSLPGETADNARSALFRAITGNKGQMTLVSSEENTVFEIKCASDQEWQPAGKGKIISVPVDLSTAYEIRATPNGFRSKTTTLPEPTNEVRFTFMISDRLPESPPAVAAVPAALQLPPEPVTQAPAGLGQRWAVVVGVSEYSFRGKWNLTNLRYASRDATALAEHLKSPQGGRFDHVVLLTDQEATVRNVRIALRERLRGVQPNDLVVIFWSGHGAPDPHESSKLYLVAYDTDPEHMAATGYAMEEFQRDIRNLQSRGVVVIADACHSAGLSDPTVALRGDEKNEIGKGLKAIAVEAAPGAVTAQPAGQAVGRFSLIFTSCEAGETSIESSELGDGHGVFTYFLLDGLKGAADQAANNGNGDGSVTLGEMIDYTVDRVRRFSQNQQHPDTAGRFDRNMTMGVAK